jgi:hypothetical protein
MTNELTFKKATRSQARLRMALVGPSGSGKTYSALNIAKYLVPGGRVAVIDTERGSASLYSDIFDFDVLELVGDYHPERFVEAIHAAEKANYDVLIIDSLSHEWFGPGGCLDLVEKLKVKYNGNQFFAWRDVTPMHNRVLDAINATPMHVIATIRAKMDYAQEKGDDGKTKITKLGLGPIQRDGAEYEFGIVGDMKLEGHTLVISKTRCPALTDMVFQLPGEDIATILRAWLNEGIEMPITKGEANQIRDYGIGKQLSTEQILEALGGISKMSEFTDRSISNSYVKTGMAMIDAYCARQDAGGTDAA